MRSDNRSVQAIWQTTIPFVKISLYGAALASLVLCAARIYNYIIAAPKPWLITTTGCEDEALLSIWKFYQHQAVFTDPRQIPFSASYFNWLFYFGYGGVCWFFMKVLHLNVIWQSTICRVLTLAISVAACGLFFLILSESDKVRQNWSKPLLLAWSIMAIFNPLVGFWVMTARPDMSALAFELAGLWLVFRYLRIPKLMTLIWAVLALYAAWSCKPTFITVLAGTSLTFLVLKQWRELALLAGLWMALVMSTLLIGGDAYRYCLTQSQLNCPFTWSALAINISRALEKDPFILLALIGIVVLAIINWRILTSDRMGLTCLLTIASAFFLELIASSKEGAQEYYFIPLATWSTLWLVFMTSRSLPLLAQTGVAGACWVIILGVGLIFTGRHGYYKNDDTWYQRYEVLEEKLTGLPGPIFVEDRFGNLPWIQPHDPHFVLGSIYPRDRAAGVPMAQGGWEGLMEAAYFNTVVETVPGSVPDSLCLTTSGSPTKAQLAHYEVISQDRYFIYYRRTPFKTGTSSAR